MVCHHAPGDPNCGAGERESSYRESTALTNRIKELERQLAVSTHDAENFEIVDSVRAGPHLVLKVKYPNCSKCLYEGNKVLVYLDVTEKDVIRWRKIDPHFREPKEKDPRSAPSPAARFPGSATGWNDAIAYAKAKQDHDPY